jgi:hypothetical protein
MARPRIEESSNDDEFDQLGVRLCARLPEGFPDEWRDLQLSVGVGLIFTEWNGINRSFFNAYAVSSVEEALATMTRDDSSFLIYRPGQGRCLALVNILAPPVGIQLL